jgi:two-component system, cell cycle sensor histidine kinase and response regulator CckA
MATFVLDTSGKAGGLAPFVPIVMQPLRGSGQTTALLVDDDDAVRGFCRSLLTASGFTVLEADNGLEALLISVQLRGAIDILITDLEMPRISGVELGRAFNELWPGVNVLYISGSPRDTVGDPLPADCVFLPKPFTPDALVHAIGSALVRGPCAAAKML